MNTVKMSFFKLLFLISIVLLFFTGCEKKEGSNEKKTVEKKSVVLKIHAWEGYVKEYEPQFIKHVKETMGIDVVIEKSMTTGLESFIDAAKNKGVHLLSPANDFLLPLHREKLIVPLDKKKLSKFKQLNPVVLNKKAHEIDGVAYGLPFNFGPYAMAYNRDKFKKAPDSYKILWDPKMKNRVSISGTYDTINIYMTALMLGIPKTDLFNLNDEQLAKVEEKLKELCKTQVSEFWEENLNPVNHKNYDLGMDWGIGVNIINKKHGGNWGYAVPKEGVTGWIDTWAMTKNVKDPMVEKVAYAYLDFMISSKVQTKMARITTYAPVNLYAGRFLSVDEKKKYYLMDPKFIEKYTLWQPLKKEVQKKYKELWNRAKAEKK